MYANDDSIDSRIANSNTKTVDNAPIQPLPTQQERTVKSLCHPTRLHQRQGSLLTRSSIAQQEAKAQPLSITNPPDLDFHSHRLYCMPDELGGNVASSGALSMSPCASHYSIMPTGQQITGLNQTGPGPSPSFSFDSMFNFEVNDISSGLLADEYNERNLSSLVTTSNEINETILPSPLYRSRFNSRTIKKPQQDLNSTHSSLYQYRESTPFAPHRLGPHASRPLSYPKTLFNRRAQASPEDFTDPTIGEVTRSGKFRCLDPSCNDLTFGRQADFKRHYENVHATKKIEYFCPQDGCDRSKHPTGGSKGRSFKGRKDKMDEHMRTVHQRKAIEKRRPESSSDEEQSVDLHIKIEKGKRAKIRHDGTD